MAATQPTGKNLKDGSVQRADLDVSTVGQAVIAKAVQGAGISLSSTGGDAGTGDVTIGAIGPTKVVFLGTTGVSTYTPTTGVRALFVECYAPGGGGGGAVASASNATAGSGGAAGGWAVVYLSGSLKASYSIIIGAGGAGGANTGGNGSPGTSNTTFDSPSVCTATVGAGGNGNAVGSTTPAFTTGRSTGGLGTVGDRGGSGGDGESGLRLSGTQARGGASGASEFNAGSAGGLNGAAGAAGVNGSGGSGASSISATGFAGGGGANGFIKVTEYF